MKNVPREFARLSSDRRRPAANGVEDSVMMVMSLKERAWRFKVRIPEIEWVVEGFSVLAVV